MQVALEVGGGVVFGGWVVCKKNYIPNCLISCYLKTIKEACSRIGTEIM